MANYPLGPLYDFVDARGGFDRVLAGLPRQERDRWRNRTYNWKVRDTKTIYERDADEFCCRILGVPPESVWGKVPT